MTMILYYAPNTCALAVHIALLEAKLAFEAVCIDFDADEQHSLRYLAINPKGRVPALVTDRGILTETPALLVFIAQAAPSAQLAPLDDPFALARLQAFNAYLCATVHVAHAHGRRGRRWADDDAALDAMRRKVPDTMRACFELMEREMVEGPWVAGDRFTICDPYLFTVTRWLAYDGIDVTQYPRISTHHQRMAQRRAVQQAMAAQGLTLPGEERLPKELNDADRSQVFPTLH